MSHRSIWLLHRHGASKSVGFLVAALTPFAACGRSNDGSAAVACGDLAAFTAPNVRIVSAEDLLEPTPMTHRSRQDGPEVARMTSSCESRFAALDYAGSLATRRPRTSQGGWP